MLLGTPIRPIGAGVEEVYTIRLYGLIRDVDLFDLGDRALIVAVRTVTIASDLGFVTLHADIRIGTQSFATKYYLVFSPSEEISMGHVLVGYCWKCL